MAAGIVPIGSAQLIRCAPDELHCELTAQINYCRVLRSDDRYAASVSSPLASRCRALGLAGVAKQLAFERD